MAPIKDENLANQIIEYMQRERGADIKLVEKNGRKYLAFPKRTDYEAYLNEAGKIYDRMMNAKARESSSDFSRNKPGASKAEGVVYEGKIPENARNVTPPKSDSGNAGNGEAKSAETAEQARQTTETKSATKSAETAEQARQTAETKSATNSTETAEQARQTTETKSATNSAETAEQVRQATEAKSATNSAETAEQVRQATEAKSTTNPAEPRKMPVQSQLGSDVLRMKVNSLDDVLVLQEALSKRRIPSAYVRGDTGGHFLSVNAKDMDVLSDIAHERLGYSKAPVNGVRVASVATMSQAGIPEQPIKMSDMHLQSRNESVPAHGETGKSTAGRITGRAVIGGLSVLSGVGAVSEFSAAQESFKSGEVGSGIYHSFSSIGMGAGSIAPFLKGSGAVIAGGVGTAGGSLMFGHDAVKDAQKGDYVSAGINAVGSASMAYETLAMASGSTVSLGTAVAAAPIAATAAAVGSSAAIGWSLGKWMGEHWVLPAMQYSMNAQDATDLVGDGFNSVPIGSEAAYIQGFVDYFNEGFDVATTGTAWSEEFRRLFSGSESRRDELLERIRSNPQAMYDAGTKGHGFHNMFSANPYLIHESLRAGAKPHGFDTIPERGYRLTSFDSDEDNVYSDFSRIFYISPRSTFIQGQVAEELVMSGAGFSVDDLRSAINTGNDWVLNRMLLTVSGQDGKRRTLYTVKKNDNTVKKNDNTVKKNDKVYEPEFIPPKEGETFILPEKMRTEENLNGLIHAAIDRRTVSAQNIAYLQYAFNHDCSLKISSENLEAILSDPLEVMYESAGYDNLEESYRLDKNDKKYADGENKLKTDLLEVLCGDEKNGYLFNTWEITPQVIKAVQHLDDKRKDAFFRYAIQNNLGKDNPEIQEALMSLMPQTTLTQQQPTEERAGSLTGTIGQSANHVNLENDQSELQYSGYMNTNARN